MHLKRNKVPKSWPITRKGSTFVVRPSGSLKEGVPILVFLRDMLKVAQNRKEVKKALYEKKVFLNQRPIADEKQVVLFYDIITIVPAKKNFRLEISTRGKFEAREIKEDDARKKIAKVIDKKVLKGKKVQINLNDGNNFISDIKCKVNDSVIINLDKKHIEKSVPLEEKRSAVIFAGKHAGKEGIIEKIIAEKKSTEIKTGDGEKVSVLIKQMMAVK
jgi:small subunit ribosomal protein S4e